ncbi:MAG: 1-acyl-sn-glycerol-3-phosphate acyltransferase [Bdellovibrionaceae bacterium]|nr:1-acyl-sn-glycerol-3-phosphate acyltransferase [Pseudobdellovibrionaceae bacterium]
MEKVQTGIRGIAKVAVFLILALSYFSVAFFVHLTTLDPVVRRLRFTRNASRFARLLCQLFNIKIWVKNKPPKNAKGLLVGNHMGFVDILAGIATMPSFFVTSQEIRETPFLGQITEMGGCLYVERRNRGNIMRELGEMVEYLSKGYRVVLYPEATSHNGEEILPFKRTLLSAAAHAGVPLRPFVFNFVSINGEPFTKKWRDHVCYYGDITFPVSIWRLLSLKEIICEIEYLEPLHPKIEDDRRLVAERVRHMIVERFKPVQPDRTVGAFQ